MKPAPASEWTPASAAGSMTALVLHQSAGLRETTSPGQGILPVTAMSRPLHVAAEGKLIENAVPDLAPMVQQEIENRLRGSLEGREVKGLPKDGSIFVAFMELPDPQGTPPKVAFILRVAKYTDFRDGLLKDDERKEVKAD